MPVLILDQHFRKVEELFSPETFSALNEICHIEGAGNSPMDKQRLARLLPKAEFLVASRPELTREQVMGAPELKAIIEVSGAFNPGLDYTACFEQKIEVLSSAPGFRYAVAEMGLAMILAGARGLVAEHEAFRTGSEKWLADRAGLDFTLFNQKVGFVGYGNIARELHRLLTPFNIDVSAYDPWLRTFPETVSQSDLETLFKDNRIVVVTAVPSDDNREFIDAEHINAMQKGALLVLLSRAHVMDFSAARKAANRGRITFATDVYPSEPLPLDDPIRISPHTILSPHRAAAVEGGRHAIGDMILHDISAILAAKPHRELLLADPKRVEGLVQAQKEIESAGKLAET